MAFTIELDGYYLTVKLDRTTKEKQDLVKSHYVCAFCQKDLIEKRNFCLNCGKETQLVRFSEKTKEEVGSRDMWDFKLVSIEELEKVKVGFTSHYFVEPYKSEPYKSSKKPKASEIEKWKQEQEKLGKSRTLKDLFVELLGYGKAIECKLVFNGKINKAYIYPSREYGNLICSVVDGNLEIKTPKQKLLETSEELMRELEKLKD